MLKVALLGYGKMGKAIEEILTKDGNKVVLKIAEDNLNELTPENLKKADVAIEFSTPEGALRNILFCLDNDVPVVSGTTGWLENLGEVKEKCIEKNGSFLYASNFSVGVNLFFELNKKLAELMMNRREYDVSIEEVHHTQKKDSPSGTAITLAQQIIDTLPGISGWANDESDEREILPVISRRENHVPGTHTVYFKSEIDDIEIKHTAHSRKGFARGAVQAAFYIADKKGVFTMKDVLFNQDA